MVHDSRGDARGVRYAAPWSYVIPFLWMILAGVGLLGVVLVGFLVLCVAAAVGPGRYAPPEQAFMAAQYQALGQLRSPVLNEMGPRQDAAVVPLGDGSYQVRSWVAGKSMVGYPVRQAFTARVYPPPGAERFEQWQLLSLQWE